MAENTTLARFAPGDNISRAFPNLWQWSRGQVLQIEGLTLPAHYTVHYSNSPFGYDPASEGEIGDAEGVAVPDSFLISGQPVYAWIWLSETTSAETAAQVIIEVNRRAQPPNYAPTPEEESIIDQAIAALNAGVAAASGYAVEADGFANESAISAQLARSWTEGGTGSREGENTNNAKYWANMAEQVAGQAGWVRFYIDDDGYLHYQKTENVALDFYIDANGILHVTGG